MRIFCIKKTFITVLSVTLFALIFVTSCADDGDKEPTILSFIRLSTDKSLVDYRENTILLSVESDTDETWRVIISDQDKTWISADRDSGTKNGTVKLIIQQNKETKDRFVKVTVATSTEEKSVYLTQTGSPYPIPDISKANWIELPAKSSIANTILVGHLLPTAPSIRNYSMLYDTINKLAYWVAYSIE